MFTDNTNLFISGINVDDLIRTVDLTKYLSGLKQINYR